MFASFCFGQGFSYGFNCIKIWQERERESLFFWDFKIGSMLRGISNEKSFIQEGEMT